MKILTASLFLLTAFALTAADHAVLYKDPVPGDKTVAAARELKIKIPVMVREWHIWWGAPYGGRPHLPRWMHWKGQQLLGKYDPATTIEQLRPDSYWRRWLNSSGYPLIGPYDSAQPSIIRWQLESAKNAGLTGMYLHLWPSLWDDGVDMTPLPIFETVLDTAASLNFPVAIHDEIAFRGPKITKAQQLESSIRRTVLLIKRYGKHPGWMKADNLPVYYFQNWNSWIKPAELAQYLQAVEKEVGPVYWVVEQGQNDEVFQIPEVRMVFSHNNSYFIHVEPFGLDPKPWDKLAESMKKSADMARKYHKKFGMTVYSRFNNNFDRGTPGRGKIPAEDGMFYVNSLKQAMQFSPDMLVVNQWNDFEEGAFLEPAWDFDGFNGDPYRYLRITAAALNRDFAPAKLPERDEIDPYIRRKLFGDDKPGDLGPVSAPPVLTDGKLKFDFVADGPKAETVAVLQSELPHWSWDDIVYQGQTLRLGNWSAVKPGGVISGSDELRFYVTALTSSQPATWWLGINYAAGADSKVVINYRSDMENFRRDSKWERKGVELSTGITTRLADATLFTWVPLYDATFSGDEGDLLITLGGKKTESKVKELILYHPKLAVKRLPAADLVALPKEVKADKPLVTVPFDALGNPGIPFLLINRK